MAFLGFYTRYWADDYCYAALFENSDFFDANISAYLTITHFASNRFSLTFFSGIFEFFGMNFIRFLPLLSIFSLFIAIFLLLSEIKNIIKFSYSKIYNLFFSELLVFFCLYLAPNRFQILYWRSGMLPYLAPIIFGTFSIFVFLTSLNKKEHKFILQFVLFFLCFFTGGFSETGIAPFLLIYLFFLIFSLINIKTIKTSFRINHLLSASSGFLGYIIAFILLICSPPNRLRMVNSEQTYNLFILLQRSITFSFDFIIDKFSSIPIPITIFVCIFFCLGVLLKVNNQTINFKWYVILFLTAWAFSITLIAASFAPTVFAQSAYPELRAQIFAMYVLLFLLAFIAILTGQYFYVLFSARFITKVQTLSLIILLLLSFYSIKAFGNTYPSLRIFHNRAETWDRRVAFIQENKELNILDFQIKAIDSYAGVIELQPNPEFWINKCAAITFGVNSLWTDE
jgi:hypothetical protein